MGCGEEAVAPEWWQSRRRGLITLIVLVVLVDVGALGWVSRA